MKTASNIFMGIGMICIVCIVILSIMQYKDEAFIVTGVAIVSTVLSDITFRINKTKNT